MEGVGLRVKKEMWVVKGVIRKFVKGEILFFWEVGLFSIGILAYIFQHSAVIRLLLISWILTQSQS